jgi:zinc D-Ala-D-Ala carboxypeptidase
MPLLDTWKNAPAGAAWRWAHFSARELACRCGGRHCAGEYYHDPSFLDALERLRGAFGILVVNSGRRCALHNAAVGGAPLSQHKVGIACDVALAGHDPVALARGAVAAGFKGLGFGRTFLHVDARVRPSGWRRVWRTPNAFHYPGAREAWTTRFGFDPALTFAATGALDD